MLNALGLLRERRFLPLFVTQFLGAFNDNLFKTSMVLFATYQIYNDPTVEQNFNALATAIGILPFFLLSALAGQLADTHDKARIIRIVKTAEILIMVVGSAGLLLAHGGFTTPGLVLMLVAVLGLGIHSAFFGPIKYAILPQHLHEDEVLGGTGLVEAATYLAILSGTIVAGLLAPFPAEMIVVTVIAVALIGWVTALFVPPALRQGPELAVNFNPFTSSWRVISATMHIPRLFNGGRADHHLPAAGEECADRQRSGFHLCHRAVFHRCRDRIGRHQRAAEGAYIGALCTGISAGDGRVHRNILAAVPRLARRACGHAL
jgi:MFS family permease